MANPFDQFDDAPKSSGGNPFDQFDSPAPKKEKPYSYSVLPVIEDEQGRPHLDFNAGLIGRLRGAASLPGDVVTGKADLSTPQAQERAFDLALFAAPRPGMPSNLAPIGYTPPVSKLELPKFLAPTETGLPKAAEKHLASAVKAEGGADVVAQRLNALGDDAMLLDAGPAMIGKAQGAALLNDKARSVLSNELRNRVEGASGRILKTADESLGVAEPSRVVEERIRREKAAEDAQNYGSALGTDPASVAPPPVDTSALIRHLDAAIPRSEGSEKQALEGLRKALFKPNPELEGKASPKASDFRVPMPKERAVGARERVKSLGGIGDDRGDLRDIAGMYKGIIRKGGSPADKVRETLAQEGYFDHLYGSPEAAVERSTPDDLFAIIDENRVPENQRGVEWQRGASQAQRAGKTQGEMWSDLRRQAQENAPPEFVPKTEAENLHKLKMELDDLISGLPAFKLGPGQFTRKEGAVIQARKLLNKILEEQVPNYKYANTKSAAYNRLLDALSTGTKILGSGPEAPWPEELATALNNMSNEERAALRVGARGRIEEKLRRTINDLTAGKTIAQGDTDFNRANLKRIFGTANVDKFTGRLDAERKFADALNKVVENSQTAQRREAAAQMKPGGIDLEVGGVKHNLIRLAEKIAAKVLPNRTVTYADLAEALTAKGAKRESILEALRRAERSSSVGRLSDAEKKRLARSLSLSGVVLLPRGDSNLALPSVVRSISGQTPAAANQEQNQ